MQWRKAGDAAIWRYFNVTATTEIFTLSLLDALPIFLKVETQYFASHKGEYAFVASGVIACGYCYGLLVRRKILRLYRAYAIE